MQSNKSNLTDKSEKDFAEVLYKKELLIGPEIFHYGGKEFVLQNFSSNKTYQCCFRCSNSSCRRHYPININSFYEKFSFFSLKTVTEIIKCNICLELNAEKAYIYLVEEKHIILSKNIIYQV